MLNLWIIDVRYTFLDLFSQFFFVFSACKFQSILNNEVAIWIHDKIYKKCQKLWPYNTYCLICRSWWFHSWWWLCTQALLFGGICQLHLRNISAYLVGISFRKTKESELSIFLDPNARSNAESHSYRMGPKLTQSHLLQVFPLISLYSIGFVSWQ